MGKTLREQADERFMQLALEAAHDGLGDGEVPIGAVLVLNDEVVATAHNRTVTNIDPTGHAEILVLRDAAMKQGSSRLDGATLYVTIEPCTMCAGAILLARVQRLVFGARELRTGAVVSVAETFMNSANTHHVSVNEGVFASKASELMKQYFKTRRL